MANNSYEELRKFYLMEIKIFGQSIDFSNFKSKCVDDQHNETFNRSLVCKNI